jgi:hypothetical protein
MLLVILKNCPLLKETKMRSPLRSNARFYILIIVDFGETKRVDIVAIDSSS